jgi:hypothetical protein
MADRCPKHSVPFTCHYTSELENLSKISVLLTFILSESFNISKVSIAILSNVEWNLMHMCCSLVCNFLKESQRANTPTLHKALLHKDAYCNSEINSK